LFGATKSSFIAQSSGSRAFNALFDCREGEPGIIYDFALGSEISPDRLSTGPVEISGTTRRNRGVMNSIKRHH
jgi:hypothetical protein